MEQIQREIQSLTDRLAAMKTTGGGRRRGRKKAAGVQQGSSQGTVTVVAGQGSASKKRGRRRKKGVASVSNNMGVVTFARRELLAPLVVKATTTSLLTGFGIVPGTFSFLKQFSMFDKVKWNKLHVFYKPGVGSTFNGMISYGVLWDWVKLAPGSRDDISSLTPNATHSLWMDGSDKPLVCPPSKLQAKPWYTPADTKDDVEKGPGVLLVAVSMPDKKEADFTVGELWVDYSVTLTGTGF